MNEKTIHIRCESKTYFQLEELNHFQGDLKSIDKTNFDKLKKSLIKEGLPLGFHVWIDSKKKVWVVDGSHRRLALLSLKEDGYHIPSLPCTIVDAKTKKEAAKIVMISNSHYAKMNQESISDFMINFELQLDELEFLDIPELNDFDLEKEEKKKIEGLEKIEEQDFKNNYIVVVFDNESDFNKAQKIFNLEKKIVNLSRNENENMNTIGLGRIIKSDLLMKILED